MTLKWTLGQRTWKRKLLLEAKWTIYFLKVEYYLYGNKNGDIKLSAREDFLP
jgi:hypothetical protein